MLRRSLTLSLNLFSLILLGTLTAQFLEGQSVNAQSATEGVINAPQTHAEALTGTEKPILPVPGGLLIDAGAGSRDLKGLDNLLGPHLGNAPDVGAYELGLGLPWHGPRSFSNLLAYGIPKGWQVSPLSDLSRCSSLGFPSSVPLNSFRILLTHTNPAVCLLATFEELSGEARWSRLDAIIAGQAGDAELVKRVSFRDGLDGRIVKRGENAQFLGGRVDDEGVLNVLGGIAASDLSRGASEAGLTLQDDFFTFFRSLWYAWHLQDISNPISLPFVPSPAPAFVAVGSDAAPSTSNAVSPGTLHGDITLTNASVIWDVEGDANLTAAAAVQFRRQGTTQWRDALDLSRVHYLDEYTRTSRNRLAGSIFRLSPGTTYEVRVVLTDPDGGSETRTTTFTTRQVPKPDQSGRTIEVRPTDDLDAVTSSAQPGDTFLLHAGTYTSNQYGSTWVIAPSGTREQPILFRAYGNGPVNFTKISVRAPASHIWLDGLTVDTQIPQAESVAIRTDDMGTRVDGLSVTRSTVKTAFYQIWVEAGDSAFIADNRLIGAGEGLSKEGIQFLQRGHGHVAAYNHITNNSDGISSEADGSDVHNNKIHDVYDDAIEPDYSWDNTRIWENLAWSSTWHGISVQQINGGPWYVFRNQLTGAGYSSFKLRKPEILHVVSNTIAMPGSTDKTWFFFRNRNIFANNFWKVRSSLGGLYDSLGGFDPPAPDPSIMRLWGYNRYDAHPCNVWRWWGSLQNAQSKGAEKNTLLVNDPDGAAGSKCGSGDVPPPSPPPPPPPSVSNEGHWCFDETSGTTAADASGNANHGTLQNGPLWTQGKRGGALAFDGSDDYVSAGDAPFNYADTVTAAAWVMRTGTSVAAWPSIFFKQSYTIADQDGGHGAGGWWFEISQGDWSAVRVNSRTVLPLNTWNHVALVADRTNLIGYINGVKVGSAPYNGTLRTGSSREFVIGRGEAADRVFPGLIDDVRIYHRALSADEVLALHNSGAGLACDASPPSTSGDICLAVRPENRVRLAAQDFSGLPTTLTITDPQGLLIYSGIRTPTNKEGEIHITDSTVLSKITDTTLYTLTAHPESHRRRKMTLLGSALKASPCDLFLSSPFGFLDESGPVTIQHLVRLIAHYRTQSDAQVNRAFLSQKFLLRDLISVIKLYVSNVRHE